jgi:hypothetical protein
VKPRGSHPRVFRATIAPLAALEFGIVDQGKEAIAPLPFPSRIG